jgi:hypothetical protein
MGNKQQIKTISDKRTHISKLERFSIGFEYDKTLRQVKHEMHIRTL